MIFKNTNGLLEDIALEMMFVNGEIKEHLIQATSLWLLVFGGKRERGERVF